MPTKPKIRTIKKTKVEGTVPRRAVRAAIKKVMAKRTEEDWRKVRWE